MQPTMRYTQTCANNLNRDHMEKFMMPQGSLFVPRSVICNSRFFVTIVAWSYQLYHKGHICLVLWVLIYIWFRFINWVWTASHNLDGQYLVFHTNIVFTVVHIICFSFIAFTCNHMWNSVCICKYLSTQDKQFSE